MKGARGSQTRINWRRPRLLRLTAFSVFLGTFIRTACGDVPQIHLTNDTSGFDLEGRVQCRGGDGYGSNEGAAGTIYLKDNAQPLGRVRIANAPFGTAGANTEILTNLVEELRIEAARVWLREAVTTETVEVSSAWVDQDGNWERMPMSVTGNLDYHWFTVTNDVPSRYYRLRVGLPGE